VTAQKTGKIKTYEEFRGAFVTPEQRRDFLLECAKMGADAVYKEWHQYDIRIFLFGSAVNLKKRVNAESDLDIAVSGTENIDSIQGKYVKSLAEAFRRGLGAERQQLPIDFVFLNVENPETWFAEEILKNGVELKVERQKTR